MIFSANISIYLCNFEAKLVFMLMSPFKDMNLIKNYIFDDAITCNDAMQDSLILTKLRFEKLPEDLYLIFSFIHQN